MLQTVRWQTLIKCLSMQCLLVIIYSNLIVFTAKQESIKKTIQSFSAVASRIQGKSLSFAICFYQSCFKGLKSFSLFTFNKLTNERIQLSRCF